MVFFDLRLLRTQNMETQRIIFEYLDGETCHYECSIHHIRKLRLIEPNYNNQHYFSNTTFICKKSTRFVLHSGYIDVDSKDHSHLQKSHIYRPEYYAEISHGLKRFYPTHEKSVISEILRKTRLSLV